MSDTELCREQEQVAWLSSFHHVFDTHDIDGLDYYLKDLEEEENYCACAGVKKVIDLIKLLKVIVRAEIKESPSL
jgi:hypothetical protein